MRQLLLVCVALLALSSAEVAHASPLFELTGGFGGMGGLQSRHTGASAAAAYFNPALLTGARSGVTAGLLVLNSNIGVHVGARSPENEVPSGLIDTFLPNGSPTPLKPLGTQQLQYGDSAKALQPRARQHQGTGDQTLPYAQVGLVVKLFKDRLALGFDGLVPIKTFLTFKTYYPDEREQYMSNSLHPEMYGDRLTALSFAFGAAAKLTKTLSLGVGATLSLYAGADAPVFVANASQLSNLNLDINVKAKVALVPHLGVAWNPKRWHFTGTLHAPQKLSVQAGFNFVLAGGVSQGSTLGFTYFYQPWQASAGLGYDVYKKGDTTWTVSGQAEYQRWSKYIDRQSIRPAEFYEWSDTISGTVGVRMKDGPVQLGLDGQYKPTPVPEQTGRTNYVDNDRLGSSLSAQYDFELFDTGMSLGLQLQLYRLITRDNTKIAPQTADGVNHQPQLVWDEVPDTSQRNSKPLPGAAGLQTNNPGWPGYKSMGWISSGGIYLSVYL